MKKNISNKAFVFTVIMLLSFSVFVVPLGNEDELWNYNFAKNISEGLQPYKDFNMVQTPLSAYISAVFLVLFGQGLLSYRIAGYLLMVCTFFLIYYLCENIVNNHSLAFIVSLFCFAINALWWGYNYNNLSLMLVLLILILEGKDEQTAHEKSYNVIIGILFGILPLIKQNTGIILFFANIVICLIDRFLYKKKSNAIRIIISIIPLMLFLTITYLTGTMSYFIDYAIVGIKYFSHRKTYVQFMESSIINCFFAFIQIYIICYVIYKMWHRDINRRKIVYFIISIAWLSIIYPLCDVVHFYIAMVPFFPLLFLFIKDINISKRQAFICDLIGIFVAVFSVISIVPFSDQYKISSIHNYEGIPIEKSIEEGILEVDNYIKKQEERGIKVYIANETSAAYTIPLDAYCKNWDMMLVGNIGTNTVEALLNVEEKSVFLVYRDDSQLNLQSHFELINYIKNNYECIGEVLNFDVYSR